MESRAWGANSVGAWRRRRSRRAGRFIGAGAAVALAGGLLAACSSGGPRVLLVGTYHGSAGQYRTIQAAVDAAHRGDWILIAPGDYHERADHLRAPTARQRAEGGVGGVLVTTPDLHLRGMDRNQVVVDGTRPGAPRCSAAPGDQDFGIAGSGGKAYGRNGIVVFRASGVSIDNLTVCNFLGGSGQAGNGIWWNGGAGTGAIGASGYRGSYLTATSTYFGGEDTAATYGIFASNEAGPATWDQLYASNFNDSGAYVGACKQACDVTIDHSWFEYNALGYSGTNSGGRIVIENSQFDHNQDGLDTNSAISGDPPAPQDGACPQGGTSPLTGTHSCWVFVHNDVHDNDNGDVPAAGSAAAGPIGTGMTVSGGRNDTIMDNTFADNGAWGVLFVPYPDSGTPVLGQSCTGTGGFEVSGFGCVYDPEGDALVHNTFVHDGYFGNPSNGDFGQITLGSGEPRNCFSANDAPDGSAPSDLEHSQPTCDGTRTTAADTGGPLLAQVLCDTGFGSCPPGAHYPKIQTAVVMRPLPTTLPSMPNPCAGVPANPWCASGSAGGTRGGAPHQDAALGAAAAGTLPARRVGGARRR